MSLWKITSLPHHFNFSLITDPAAPSSHKRFLNYHERNTMNREVLQKSPNRMSHPRLGAENNTNPYVAEYLLRSNEFIHTASIPNRARKRSRTRRTPMTNRKFSEFFRCICLSHFHHFDYVCLLSHELSHTAACRHTRASSENGETEDRKWVISTPRNLQVYDYT